LLEEEIIMASRLNPYLSFKSNTREAMDFYKTVFGGAVNVMPFGDMARDAGERDMVMHAQLDAPNGFTLMASDTPASMGAPRGNGMISLSGDQDAELRGYWQKLSAGAQVMMPLEKAPWGDTFGMLTDKYGVGWMVNIAGPRG
jgi:PhnB protein